MTITATIRVMADTRTKTGRDADTTGANTLTDGGDDVPTAADRARQDSGVLKKATEGIKAAFGKTTDPPAQQAPASPPPAVSYAGSGTTEPHELNPATHGAHYRGPQGSI